MFSPLQATKKKETISFYTMTEYETWKEENNNGQGWKIKYYKGLGTSSAQEAKEYFSELQRHKIDFAWGGDEDGDAIDMAFSKKRVEDRKTWISKFEVPF
jgi:DNA topoisomerase-2